MQTAGYRVTNDCSRQRICLAARRSLDYASANGSSCFAAGGVVTRLTRNRHSSDVMRAGMMASRSLMTAGSVWWMKGVSQKRVTTVPVAMLATAAAAVALRQKNAARMTGVRAAE